MRLRPEAQSALHDVADAEQPPDLARPELLRRDRQRRGIGDDVEPAEAGQAADDVERNPGGHEARPVDLGEQVERHHRDRGRRVEGLGERRRLAQPDRRRDWHDQRRQGRRRQGREAVGDGGPLIADPVLELGIDDVEAGRELRQRAGQVPVLGVGIERDADPGRVEPDPCALGQQAGCRVAERAAQAGELLAQARPALLLAAIAPQLVLEPAARPLVARRHPEQRQQALALAPLRRQLAAVAPKQPHRTDQAELELVFVCCVLDHSALSGA